MHLLKWVCCGTNSITGDSDMSRKNEDEGVSLKALEDAFGQLRYASEVAIEPNEVLVELGSRVIEIRTQLALARSVDCASIDRDITEHAWTLLPAIRNSTILDSHKKMLVARGVNAHDCWWLKKRFWAVVEQQRLEKALAMDRLALQKGA